MTGSNKTKPPRYEDGAATSSCELRVLSSPLRQGRGVHAHRRLDRVSLDQASRQADEQ